MNSDRPFISFVFCTDSVKHLQEFSEGLIRLHARTAAKKMELVIVTPIPEKICEIIPNFTQFFDVQCLKTTWGCRGTSRNEGFAAARGEWVYFLDQDVRLNLGNLGRLSRSIEALDSQPLEIQMVTGGYLSNSKCSYWGACYNWLSSLWLKNSKTGVRVLAGNLILRKSFFVEPPFNPNFRSGGEEIELCSRIGGVSILADFAAIHQADHSLALFWQRIKSHARVKQTFETPARSTRFSFAVFCELVCNPKHWFGVVVYTLATCSGQLARGSR